MNLLNYFRLHSTVGITSNTDQITTETSSQSQKLKLIYRGVVYEVPKGRFRDPSPSAERSAKLIGQRLYYRGETYEITAIATPKTPCSLTGQRMIYRGETYVVN
jgi:hypothetical protein